MKKIITLIMCLVCFCSYAQIWEGNGGDWLSEDIAVGSGGEPYTPPVIDPTQPIVSLNFYDSGTIVSSMQFNVGAVVEPNKMLTLSKTGGIFEGWTNEFFVPVTTITLTTATSVYAKWSGVEYRTITWNAVDESQSPAVTTSIVTTHEVGSAVATCPATPAIPSGYDWLEYDYYTEGMIMPNRNLVMTAKITHCPVYGFSVVDNVPSTFAYTDDAVNMTQINATVNPHGNLTASPTSWKSFIYEIAKPCMLKADGSVDYYLSQDDVRLKEDGETPSELASNWSEENDSGNNAMVEIAKLYTCLTYEESTRTISFKVSRVKKNSSFLPTGFVRSDGKVSDHIYVGMFKTPWIPNAKTLGWRSVNLGRYHNSSTDENAWIVQSTSIDVTEDHAVGCIDNINYTKFQSSGYRCIDYNIYQLIMNLEVLMYKRIIRNNEPYAPRYGQNGSPVPVYAGETLTNASCCSKGKFMWMENNTLKDTSNRFTVQGLVVYGNKIMYKSAPPYDVPITDYTDTGIVQSSSKLSGKIKILAANNILLPYPEIVTNSVYDITASLFNQQPNCGMAFIPYNGGWWFNNRFYNQTDMSGQLAHIVYTNDPSSHAHPLLSASAPRRMMMSAPRQQEPEPEMIATPTEDIATESEEIQ